MNNMRKDRVISRCRPGSRLLCLFLFMLGAFYGCRSEDPASFTNSAGLAHTPTPFQPLPPGVEPGFPQPGDPQVASPAPLSDAVQTAQEDIRDIEEDSIWIDPHLPQEIRENIALPRGWNESSKENAGVVISFGEGRRLANWFFALVAPFPTVQDSISAADLHGMWNGNPPDPLAGIRLTLSPFTQNALAAAWGPPGGTVSTLAEEELLGAGWSTPATWAIVPFEQLEPRWKVLSIDGISPIQNDFNGLDYALRLPVAVQGSAGRVEGFLRASQAGWYSGPSSNRDPEKLTVLAMTGVTALVRATAHTMENIGINYPGQAIQDWLAGADLTHISNEVPFAKDCPFPNPVQAGVVFCSDERYIELLEFVGTDIVELTGDHFADWGGEAMLFTLDLYDARGWPYYGGGRNLSEGKKPITLEHNGNRLAFIGCNGKGGEFASATTNSPGSAACDFPYMESEIRRLVSEGYQPIATFQHFEYYYYEAQPAQIRDFRRLADAGAVIVSGSQAHQPQGMEFYQGAWIHYGLGNLFFDQYLLGTPTRQGFIDQHVFYDNRHISTELLTIWFVDFAQSQPMNPDQREELLNAVFRASGW